ncbi:MAG: hypothetical protein HYW25_03630, partial [Candidatus Aenigmarchaeota archaeon]|nr:hypothetical protein [Candidatus Aenigmarchaeota archaeon]
IICMAVDIKKRDLTDEELAAAVLYKFWYMRAGVKYHIYRSDVPKGFPPNLHKLILDAADDLARKGLLRKFPHGKEHVYQLNLANIGKIREILKKFYPEIG